MIISDLMIGFIAGAVWVLVGFYVCVMVVDRCLYLKKWLDHSVPSSIVLVMLWPVALIVCGGIQLVQKKQSSREAL